MEARCVPRRTAPRITGPQRRVPADAIFHVQSGRFGELHVRSNTKAGYYGIHSDLSLAAAGTTTNREHELLVAQFATRQGRSGQDLDALLSIDIVQEGG